MYKAILFDLWGTLADFRLPELENLAQAARTSIGMERWSIVRQHFLDWHRADYHHAAFLKKLLSDINLNDDEITLVTAWITYDEFTLFPETMEMLSWLKDHRIKLGLVTNSPPTSYQHFMNFGLNIYFDALSFSFKLGYLKPGKEIFDDAIEKLDVERSSVVMVGDSIDKDMEGAQNAGIDGLLIDREGTKDYPHKIRNLRELKTLLREKEQ